MGSECVLGIGGTSMPGLQERHGPHSTKSELTEASVCALTYSVTHCDRNDCHSKHRAAFLLIGNTISHGTKLSPSSTRSKRRVLRVAARRRYRNPALAGEASDLAASTCGGGVRRCRDSGPTGARWGFQQLVREHLHVIWERVTCGSHQAEERLNQDLITVCLEGSGPK